jgi:Zn-dependent protease
MGKKSNLFNILILLGKLFTPVFNMVVKLLKAAKVIKVGLIAGSVAAYSYLFTWQFALIIITFLFVHEYGHVWAMKRCGLKVKGMYFIPFMGAAAVSNDDFGSCRNEVYIALMGPIWGMILAFGFYATYTFTNMTVFAGAAIWMFMVTLINLLPIMPLDGGRVIRCVAESLHSWGGIVVFICGIVIAILLTKYLSIGLIFLFLIIGGLEVIGSIIYRIRLRREMAKVQKRLHDLGVISYGPPLTSFTDDERIEQFKNGVIILNNTFNRSIKLEANKFPIDSPAVEEYAGKLDHAFFDLEIEESLLNKAQVNRLSRRGIGKAAAAFIGIAVICLVSLYSLKSIPGSDMALNILEDRAEKSTK